MNSKIYRQADSRWGSLPYPTSAYKFASNGCGCCACTHNIIEIAKYANYTPANVRPWMVKQGFATKGHGTTWNGITLTLQHYGFKVSTPNIGSSMTSAWEILGKANAPKQGVLLFRAGSRNGVRWTSGGHYVAFLNYKVENGKHYFYTKDSGGRKHDGWYCYETYMKGLLPKIWIVTEKPDVTPAPTPTPKPTPAPTPAPTGKIYTGTFPTKTIKKGSKGTQVVRWQNFLKWMGYSLKADGKFGPITVEKTKAAQKKFGFTGKAVDGIVGPNTLKKAKAYRKQVNP